MEKKTENGEQRDLTILHEMYHLGELPTGLSELEQSDDNRHDTLKNIEKSNAEILKKYAPKRFMADLENRLASQEAQQEENKETVDVVTRGSKLFERLWQRVKNLGTSLLRPAALVPMAAALTLLVVAGMYFTDSPSGESIPGVRLKGIRPALRVYSRSDGAAIELAHMDSAAEGDILQLGYLSGGRKYGVIVSIDGRDVITLHFPATVNDLPLLQHDGEVLLPYAYQLDDAPKYEQFIFLTSEKRFDVDQLLRAMEKGVINDDILGFLHSIPELDAVEGTAITIQKRGGIE